MGLGARGGGGALWVRVRWMPHCFGLWVSKGSPASKPPPSHMTLKRSGKERRCKLVCEKGQCGGQPALRLVVLRCVAAEGAVTLVSHWAHQL